MNARKGKVCKVQVDQNWLENFSFFPDFLGMWGGGCDCHCYLMFHT